MQCANAILAVNPNALIFVEGVEQSMKRPGTSDYWGMPDSLTDSPYYGAWWGGNLRGAREYPIVPDSGTSQIVYSPHDYGPSVYAQTWFEKDFTTETLLEDYWYDTWAYMVEEDIAPLLIGEWGGHMDGGKNQKWMTLLRDYMINNHINHTFWCLNPNSGDTGGLLSYDFMTWDNEKYGLFEPSLWQTQTSGKYIGLDHQKALGNNGTGISLSEFYASYAKTEGSNLDGGTIGSNPIGTTAPPQSTTTTTTTTTTTSTTPANDSPTRLGDANCDGVVKIDDVVLINRFVGEDTSITFTQQGKINADTDGSGLIDSYDSIHILEYLAGLSASVSG